MGLWVVQGAWQLGGGGRGPSIQEKRFAPDAQVRLAEARGAIHLRYVAGGEMQLWRLTI